MAQLALVLLASSSGAVLSSTPYRRTKGRRGAEYERPNDQTELAAEDVDREARCYSPCVPNPSQRLKVGDSSAIGEIPTITRYEVSANSESLPLPARGVFLIKEKGASAAL